MATETELKLALDPAQRRALLRHRLLAAATPLGSRRLTNIYYDTPDLALRKRGVALRLRRQGGQWLQTVKCAGEVAGGLSARPEWEAPYDGIAFDFGIVDDAALRRWLERGRIRNRLTPVFETVFTRRSWRSEPAEGVAVLLMLDAGAIASGGAQAPISELELELAAGDADDLLALALRLATDLPLHPEPLSKAQRGYLLFEGAAEKPCKAGPSPLTPELAPVEGFRAVALECIAQIQANAAGARENRHPEFLHQLRVALRRLRSALRVFAPALDSQKAAGVAGELAALAGRLGAARDWDVLATEVLAPACAAFPADARLARLAAAAAGQRERSQAAARAALSGRDYGRVMLQLLAFCRRPAPATTTPAPRLAAFARGELARLQRRVRRRARRAAALGSAALHRVRIAAKHLRYALEFFAPLRSGRRLREPLGHIVALQESLGQLNDLANAARLLEEAAGADAALREAAALVIGWHGPRRAALLARVPADLGALAGERRF